MNTEAERYLKKAHSVRNVQESDGRVIRATRYLTHRERTAKEDELQNLKTVLSPTNIAASAMSQEGRAHMAGYHNFLQRDLAENAPPKEITGEARDELVKHERELAEQIREGMLSVETMRRNPPGAVGEHIKWERKNKEKILAWKNIRRLNNPDDDDEDLANVEMLRPSVAGSGMASTFMADAQIPGHFAQTSLAKENWPLGEPKIDTPLAQAERREFEELKARMVQLEAELKADRDARKPKPRERKVFMSDEKREAARQRGVNLALKAKAAREAKMAAAAELK